MNLQKRLHISGLTPAITVNDLKSRLRGFGNVVALDGFGSLDAVGQPRKFAYVTLEATESNLARCLNVLSGTTWKGAKLRIGEAKPDYIQRFEAEGTRAAEASEERPTKRRRLPRGIQGVHSKDMSPVSVNNVDRRPGWHKTALSHLIRPMKMRPARPLPTPMLNTAGKVSAPNRTKLRKPKLARTGSSTRARVRVIDPRLYGPVHLRENMLDAVVIDTKATTTENARSPSPSSSENENVSPTRIPDHDVPPIQEDEYESPSVKLDFAREKQRDLEILMTMFGEDASDWGGKEPINSGEDSSVTGSRAEIDGLSKKMEGVQPDITSAGPPVEKSPVKSLRDMFKPREEEGFSLLSGLGEMDIDPDFDLDYTTPAVPIDPAPARISQAITPTQPSTTVSSLSFNPDLPFFFPRPENTRAKDLFGMARAEGWKFGRTGDADAIRQRWDTVKGPLTREWKKRAREAVKARKRRYGNVEGEA